jgi:hypothetical protein
MIKKLTKYIGGFTVAGIIELVTYIVLPKASADIWCHRASYSASLPLLYYIVLFLSVVFFTIYAIRNKFKGLTFPLCFVLLAIIHTTFLMWSLNCSCGDP